MKLWRKCYRLRNQYPDVPDSLLQLLRIVDGTYYRVYAGEKTVFYFLGSDLEEYPYYLLSADQMCWLHFSDCMNNGGTSQLFLDFSPSAKGTKGQVVRFLHDPDNFTVIADSFDAYLEMLMEYEYDFITEETIEEE